MKIRALVWYDLPALYRFRKQVLTLDSTLALTRGVPHGPWWTLAYLNPRQGVYTGVCIHDRGQPPLLGQVRHTHGARSARLVFLMPREGLNSMTLPGLLDHLAVQAGRWGAFHFLAEVDDQSTVFEGLRRAGFSVYAWQRVWRFPGMKPAETSSLSPHWQKACSSDVIPVRGLYQSLVPPLVQPMEALPEKRLNGLVYRRSGDLLAYADLIYGRRGIWVQPFIHPAVDNISELLADLLCCLPRRAGRPVYLCVRSYQGWLEAALADFDLEAGPKQALMVKHLALIQRVAVPSRLPSLENGHVEPSAPIVQPMAKAGRYASPTETQ